MIALLLVGVTAISQVEFGIYQDGKLVVMEDEHGNKPYTMDLLSSMRWYNGGSAYDFLHPTFVQLIYEHADLYGGSYSRLALGFGYSFDNFSEYDWKVLDKVMKKMSVTLATDFGNTLRWGGQAFSVAGYLDLSYEVFKDLKITLLSQVVTRPHLKDRYGTTKPTYSLYGGLKYFINNN